MTPEERDTIKAILMDADDRLTLLGLQIDRIAASADWDPDAYYTPLECELRNIARAVGLDYSEDIAGPAYRRRAYLAVERAMPRVMMELDEAYAGSCMTEDEYWARVKSFYTDILAKEWGWDEPDEDEDDMEEAEE